MTEAEWLAATGPSQMLNCLEEPTSERKLRLFGVACCRQNDDLLQDPRLKRAVEIGEKYADGEVNERDRSAAEAAAVEIEEEDCYHEFSHYLSCPAEVVAKQYTTYSAHSATTLAGWIMIDGEPTLLDTSCDELAVEQAEFLRCIFGNPFCSVTFDPAWRTSTAVGIADAIYADRAFDRLPILADALQDAGCEDAAILDHCRGPGPHVRGCWVVDLVLGKE